MSQGRRQGRPGRMPGSSATAGWNWVYILSMRPDQRNYQIDTTVILIVQYAYYGIKTDIDLDRIVPGLSKSC